MSSRTNSLPPNFDPFKTHPFTNISRAPHQGPAPHQATQAITSFVVHSPNAPPPSSSLPTSQTPTPTATTPLHAPQAKRTSPMVPNATRTHVFEPFTLDRASPDLLDVLAKKGNGRVRGRNDAKAIQKQASK